MSFRFCLAAAVLTAIPLAASAQSSAAPKTVDFNPSFDCKQAKNAVEKTICDDPYLSDADRALAALFAERLSGANASDRKRLIDDQKTWLKERSECIERDDPDRPRPLLGDMQDCIKGSYNGRIAELDKPLEKFVDLHEVVPEASDVCSAVKGLVSTGRGIWVARNALPFGDEEEVGSVSDVLSPEAIEASANSANAADGSDLLLDDPDRWTIREKRVALYPDQPEAWLVTAVAGSAYQINLWLFEGTPDPDKAGRFLQYFLDGYGYDEQMHFVRFNGQPYVTYGYGVEGVDIEDISGKSLCNAKPW